MFHFCFSNSDIKTFLDSIQLTIINVTTSPKCQIDELKLCRKGEISIKFLLNQFWFIIFLSRTVLIELVALGSLQTDVKSIASTWKHISKLATGYHSVYLTLQQQPDDATSNDSLDWLNMCIESICKLIEENLAKSSDAVKKNPKMLTFSSWNNFFFYFF